MNSKFHQTILKYTIFLGGINFLLSCFVDQGTVDPKLYPMYCVVNVLFFLVSACIFWLNKKKGYSQKKLDIFFVMIVVWGLFSQFLIPAGYLTIIIGIFVYSLFNEIPLKKFISLTVLSCILSIAAILLTSTIKEQTPELVMDTKQDFIHTTIMMMIFVNLAYITKHKTLEKLKEIENKLIDLGSKSSIFIHDLKSLVFPLNSEISILLAESDSLSEEQKGMVSDLKNTAQELTDYIKEFNQSFSFKREKVEIDLNDVIVTFRKMYKNKISSNIKIEVNQNESLFEDSHMVKSILTNLILNSCEVFNEKNIKNPSIKIGIKNRVLSFQDNAGGMPLSKLKDIQEDNYFSTKKTGSGIGMFTIKKYADLLKASVNFENKNEGLLVSLSFNKK